MDHTVLNKITSQAFLDSLLPREISDRFFEALYGDVSEGAYDIRLECVSADSEKIVLAFNLIKRPGKCLVCSLTYGLPTVFSRHPLIDVKGMIHKMKSAGLSISSWRMGETRESSASLHVIPLYLYLA